MDKLGDGQLNTICILTISYLKSTPTFLDLELFLVHITKLFIYLRIFGLFHSHYDIIYNNKYIIIYPPIFIPLQACIHTIPYHTIPYMMIMTCYAMCADFGLQERVPEVSEDFTGGKDEVTKNQATTKDLERISSYILISFVRTANRFRIQSKKKSGRCLEIEQV